MKVIIAKFQHTSIPALRISITKTVGISGKDLYLTTREGSLIDGFNYLSCGRATLAEARDAANYLWTDAVTRAAARAS
jgi:hypothetical protein